MELTISSVKVTIIGEDNKVVNVNKFVVSAEDGVSYDGDFHESQEAAQAVIDSAKNGLAGFEFAKAQYPELSLKGQKTKSNVISEYLTWLDNDKPVKELEEPKEAE